MNVAKTGSYKFLYMLILHNLFFLFMDIFSGNFSWAGKQTKQH